MSLLEAALESLSPADRDKALAIMRGYQASFNVQRITYYAPYRWQQDFHAAGAQYPERLLMAANGVGKTHVAAAEVALHLTGLYDFASDFCYPERMPNGEPHPTAGEPVWPNGWKGKRFDKPVEVWTGSPTNETSKQNIQPVLLGDLGENLGTGWVPRHLLLGKPTTRQAGVKDVADSFKVRHRSGGYSSCFLKTYEQGWQKWQGGRPHVVWLDEEPDNYMIYSEAQTRVLRTSGIILCTLTPLLGVTNLIEHFQTGGPGIYIRGATWDDAPHLSKEEKERLAASYRAHERDARTKGIPMMGEGAIFPIPDDAIRVDPFKIPAHWARIKGCDFGFEHDAAGVSCAWDRDRDVFYVIDCYKAKGQLAPYHAAWFNKQPEHWVPVAWPHDGMNTSKGSGEKVKEAYVAQNVRMLGKSARYPKASGDDKEKGGSQDPWPAIDEMRERMMTGRFKVFSHLESWFEEKRSYHVKATPEGGVKIVARRDDLMAATRYALMMKRYAMSANVSYERVSMAPIASMRM